MHGASAQTACRSGPLAALLTWTALPAGTLECGLVTTNNGNPPCYFMAPGGGTQGNCSAAVAVAAAVKLPGFSCFYDSNVDGHRLVVDAAECDAVADGINAAIFDNTAKPTAAPTVTPIPNSSTGDQGATKVWIVVISIVIAVFLGGGAYWRWHRWRSAAPATVDNSVSAVLMTSDNNGHFLHGLHSKHRPSHDDRQLQSPNQPVHGGPEERLMYDDELGPAVFEERDACAFCDQCGILLRGAPKSKFCESCRSKVGAGSN